MSEERLSAAAAEWSATFDAMNDSVALFDSGGKVLRCNAATAELTGRSYNEIIGRACHEVFHGSEEWHRSCPQLRARVSLRSESAVLEQDGRWLRVTFQPMSDAAGNYSGGVHVVSDVTELTQAEQALRASETRFRSLFEDAPIAMWRRITPARDRAPEAPARLRRWGHRRLPAQPPSRVPALPRGRTYARRQPCRGAALRSDRQAGADGARQCALLG